MDTQNTAVSSATLKKSAPCRLWNPAVGGRAVKGLWLEPFTNRLAVGTDDQSTASLTV